MGKKKVASKSIFVTYESLFVKEYIGHFINGISIGWVT